MMNFGKIVTLFVLLFTGSMEIISASEAMPGEKRDRAEAATDKLFVCDYVGCHKSYKSLQGLKYHKCSHTGDYRFSCSACKLGCASITALDEHNRAKHTGEKPFKCAHCDFSFAAKNNLKHHENTHLPKSAQQPFICEICSAIFHRKPDLTRHAKMHGKHQFSCTICSMEFYRKDRFDAHSASRKHQMALVAASLPASAPQPAESSALDVLLQAIGLLEADYYVPAAATDGSTKGKTVTPSSFDSTSTDSDDEENDGCGA